jgi:hypothetical protein
MYCTCAIDGTIREAKPDDDPVMTNYLFTLGMLERCPNFTNNMVVGGVDGCVGA